MENFSQYVLLGIKEEVFLRCCFCEPFHDASVAASAHFILYKIIFVSNANYFMTTMLCLFYILIFIAFES